MKECFIGFGKCSKFYIFIAANVLFNTISYFSYQYSLFKNILVVKNLFQYFSFSLFGYILLYLEKKKTIKETKLIDNNSVIIATKDIIELFLICLIFVIFNDTEQIIDSLGFYDLEFWTINILCMLLFMRIYFPSNIYKHRAISMLIIIVVDSGLLILCSFYKTINNNDVEFINIYQKMDNYWKYAFFFFLYAIIIFFISFAQVKAKVLMDLKFLSPYAIIFLIGIFGFIINIILAIIFLIKGKECEDNNTEDIYYFYSVTKYFCKWSKLENWYCVVKELILIIAFLFFPFLTKACEFFIIKFLYPNFLLMSTTVYYEFVRLKEYLEYVFNKKVSNLDSGHHEKFIVFEISEFLEFICCLIYLEILELRFCGLDKYLKKNITKRAETESAIINFDDPLYDQNNNSNIEE